MVCLGLGFSNAEHSTAKTIFNVVGKRKEVKFTYWCRFCLPHYAYYDDMTFTHSGCFGNKNLEWFFAFLGHGGTTIKLVKQSHQK